MEACDHKGKLEKSQRMGKNQVKGHYAVLENGHVKLEETEDGLACWDSQDGGGVNCFGRERRQQNKLRLGKLRKNKKLE